MYSFSFLRNWSIKSYPLRKRVFQCSDKNQPKFCRKTSWKEQPFIFTVYLMNHIFQTSVLLIRVTECIIELNWLCKHIKKVRSSQPAIFVLNWTKHCFSLWVSSINCTLREKISSCACLVRSGAKLILHWNAHSTIFFNSFFRSIFEASAFLTT